MRTFIAIEFDTATKHSISELQNKIKGEAKRGGTFTDTDNLHLTLHFLGEIASEDLEYAAEAIASTAAANRAFKLNFDRVGYFDRGERCILWLGADKSRELVRLHETLERNLTKQGFKRERASFTPHITLAREISFFSSKKVALEKFKPDFEGMIVNEISLMESKRMGGRLVYKKLYGAKLI